MKKNVVTIDDGDDDNDEDGREIKSARDDDQYDAATITDGDPQDAVAEDDDFADGRTELPPGELNPCLAQEMKKLGRWFNPAAASVATHAM
jgi:hypothetical protein